MQRRSIAEGSSDASYCDREVWDRWESHSSLCQVDEVASRSSRPEDVSTLRAERDELARALGAERLAAAEAARAHDARLAELHGVIAELVRRRAADKHARAIPEEELDECSSPVEMDENSRTERNDSSLLSGEGGAPDPPDPPPADTRVEGVPLPQACACDASLDLSDQQSASSPGTGRCRGRTPGDSGGSCDRERGSSDAPPLHTASPGRTEPREAKLASRVRLRRADDSDSTRDLDEAWSEGAERLALEVGAQADLREALLAANNDGATLTALLAVSRARCQRLEADVAVLQCALASAHDTQHRLYCACCVQEQRCVSLCAALTAADRALETYDVLLALQETHYQQERAAAELVARQLVAALDAEQGPPAAVGGPLLSPGPWLQHDHQPPAEAWSAALEARLRSHAARLKADTVSLRPARGPTLFSIHDTEESEPDGAASARRQHDMEAAVMMQEVLEAREAAATRDLHAHTHAHTHTDKHQTGGRSRRRREARSETDL